ncbi:MULTISPECIES: acyltransferase [Rhodopseudomonas]|nr:MULTISPECIES: acyltransferase [Rhodopseudomonas]
MTSHAATPTDAEAIPNLNTRNVALDRVRTFLTLVVLLHHAVIPYTYFGQTDAKSWIGFDAIILATDSFFMAMFFFLSGLFVWPSLADKEAEKFLRDRLLRLALPFALAALTVIPIAYFAIALRRSPGTTFAVFWWKTITVGPWPSGPVWFAWVLLAFDLTASVLYRVSPNLVDPINRLSLRGCGRPTDFFIFLLVMTAMLYIPMRIYFGPGRWFEFGPFSVQASRVLLYPAYFMIGVGVGAANLHRGLLSMDGRLAKNSWVWAVAALAPYCLLWALIFVKRGMLENPVWLPAWYEASYGFFFSAFSAATLFAILGYFLRFKRSGRSMLDRMQAEAYGMFLVHYPIVLWLQYWLFDFEMPAIAKATVVFVLTVVSSWAVTGILRKIPGAARVL